ncbi:MAG: outer membrane lipoprotein-sorting protein [Calditrichaeota bacterium]|nr:MAG: outer membrane lipoprotein-sorting protein [Calditrichota bacterium]
MRTKYILTILVVFFIVVSVQHSGAQSLTALEIVTKMQDREDGDNSISDMEMILIDKNKKTRVRKIRTFTKDKGEDSQRIMFFLSPSDVKGTGFLTYDFDDYGKDDDQWLYLPALKKVKRISASDKSSSFMGSDFNYSDMTSKNLPDYNFTLMKELEIDGVKAWQIQSIPKTTEIMDETGYEKGVIFIRQDNFVAIRGIYWVYKSNRRKYMEVKNLQIIDGVWTATEIHMTTKEGRESIHKTIIKHHDVRYNQELNENLFTTRQLEKGL